MSDKNAERVDISWAEVIDQGETYKMPSTVNFSNSIDRALSDPFFTILRQHIAENDHVLEAGCGMGYMSFALAAQGCKSTALDISGPIVDGLKGLKRSMQTEQTSTLSILHGDIMQIGQQRGEYNLIFNHGVYEHFLSAESRIEMLNNCKMALQDDGKLVIAIPYLKNPLFWLALRKQDVPSMVAFCLEELVLEIEAAGYSVLDKGYLFVAPGFEEWLKYSWIATPIDFISNIWDWIPLLLKKYIAAHIYCVGQKKELD